MTSLWAYLLESLSALAILTILGMLLGGVARQRVGGRG